MAANGDIYIGPTGNEILLSPFGRELNIIPREIKKTGETAGGILKIDIQRVKYRFELPYNLIDGDTLATLLTMQKLHSKLNLKIYYSPTTWFLNDTGAIPVVYMNPISRKRASLLGNGLWENASLILEEF
jgi:hypothetical protein